MRSAPAKFLRQKPIENYIVDFYCHAKKLAIELDGDSHFLNDGAIAKDKKRDEILFKKHQIKVVRFSNSEVVKNFDGVCEEIWRLFR